ncbi:hypothetical protein [Mucilaginibacter myungsuensis]|uniref:OB fold (BOF) protein n=1 Tax=Mucilaginibacter myungsuensis TaxID=649104 RepID=A0A929KUI8_9SPHI|nr:hypothetical protein [Mucilaginibacter myungsuensis]MBE9661037.1 hypothetical protein [Mucilaginibacter myungsuensis]MDN3597181.1 hypothetical protein [Mucilaginibacter myungsuensis]
MKKALLLIIAIAAFTYNAKAQTVIAAKDAAKHIGDSVKITAKIFSGKTFASNMTLLDIGGFNPNQELTLMIPADAKSKFKGDPATDFKGKDVIVTGKIIDYKGKPEIILLDPKQIKLVLIDSSKGTPIIERQ